MFQMLMPPRSGRPVAVHTVSMVARAWARRVVSARLTSSSSERNSRNHTPACTDRPGSWMYPVVSAAWVWRSIVASGSGTGRGVIDSPVIRASPTVEACSR